MLTKIKIEHILFLDIETVPENKNFSELDSITQELFDHKTAYQRQDGVSPEQFYERAGIWAEFGKIICISVGYFNSKENKREFRVTSYSGEESYILEQFSTLLFKYFKDPKYILCGHNIKEFDIPFIARRYLINNLTLPDKINLMGKKSWEIPHLDTMELWKFGDYKHYTSLKLLTHVLGIPSPKDDIDGSQVAQVYYIDNNIDRIITYCEKDVIATAQVVLKLKRLDLLSENEIFVK